MTLHSGPNTSAYLAFVDPYGYVCIYLINYTMLDRLPIVYEMYGYPCLPSADCDPKLLVHIV